MVGPSRVYAGVISCFSTGRRLFAGAAWPLSPCTQWCVAVGLKKQIPYLTCRTAQVWGDEKARAKITTPEPCPKRHWFLCALFETNPLQVVTWLPGRLCFAMVASSRAMIFLGTAGGGGGGGRGGGGGAAVSLRFLACADCESFSPGLFGWANSKWKGTSREEVDRVW